MRYLRTLLLLLLLSGTLARPAQAQWEHSTMHEWVVDGSFPMRNHVSAHAIGGIGLDLVVRLPFFNDRIRKHTFGRLIAVMVLQSAWEFWQLKETEGYPLKYAAADVGVTVVSAALLERLLR